MSIDEKSPIEKLQSLTGKMKKPLMTISGIFPFDLFPDTISVDKEKIDIVYHHGFSTQFVFTVFMKDLTTIKVNNGIFFATLLFEVKGYEQNPDPVRFLNRNDANDFRDLVIGLRVAGEEDIDVDEVPTTELKGELMKIGNTRGE